MPFFDPIRIGAAGAADTAFTVNRSFRFNDDSKTHLSRTPSGAGNRKVWTYSIWVKRGNLGTSENATLLHAYDGSSSNRGVISFNTSNQLKVDQGGGSGSSKGQAITTAVFRDPSAWYHVVVSANYSDSTASDRVKVYVNGIQQSLTFNVAYTDENGQVNGAFEHEIGAVASTNSPFDGYLAEINFVDGQAYDPSYFGETNAITGQWNPKEYTGSYGSNGFYLDFSDNSNITNLCLDKSGNGNNFSPDNCNTEDSMLDTPTNNFATLNALDFNGGSLVEGNLKQDNSGATNTSGTFGMQSGKWYWEIYFNSSSGGVFGVGIGESRKGSALNDLTRHYGYSTNGQFYTTVNGSSTAAGYGATLSAGDILSVKFNADTREIDFLKNNSSQGYTVTLADGFLYLAGFHANNSDITVNFGQDSTFAGATSSGGNTDGSGQGDFKYAVPSGYKALCSANLPDPTILLPNKHFDTFKYTATGNAMSFSGLNFQPDWIWQKRRDNVTSSYFHYLFDSVRGGIVGLQSNTTFAEFTGPDPNITFTSNGYDMAASTGGQGNGSGGAYVSWNWNAGDTDGKTYTVTVVDDSGNKYRFDGFGTSAVTLDLAEGGTYIFNYPSAHPLKFSTTSDGTHGGGSEYTTGVTHNSSTQVTIVVAASAPQLFYYCGSHSGMGGAVNTNSTLGSSNFDGTIQSVVKASPTAGFSITKYSGNGTDNATVGHGLGVKPDVVIIKLRTGDTNWMIYHNQLNLGVDPEDYFTEFSTQSQVNSVTPFNDTAPTSSVINLKGGNEANKSGGTHIMYCFSGVQGYSKFGRYIGNGSDDGTFIFLGFRPAVIFGKNISSNNSWVIYDNKRDAQNLADLRLRAHTSAAEDTHNGFDFLSNGFKTRNGSSTSTNSNGNSYIYFAFAESPFKNARAR